MKTTKKVLNTRTSILDLPIYSGNWQHEETRRTVEDSDSPLQSDNEPVEASNYLSQSPPQPVSQAQQVSEESASTQQDILRNNSDQTNIMESHVRSSHPMITRAKSGIFKPKLNVATITTEEPEIFDQAAKDKN